MPRLFPHSTRATIEHLISATRIARPGGISANIGTLPLRAQHLPHPSRLQPSCLARRLGVESVPCSLPRTSNAESEEARLGGSVGRSVVWSGRAACFPCPAFSSLALPSALAQGNRGRKEGRARLPLSLSLSLSETLRSQLHQEQEEISGDRRARERESKTPLPNLLAISSLFYCRSLLLAHSHPKATRARAARQGRRRRRSVGGEAAARLRGARGGGSIASFLPSLVLTARFCGMGRRRRRHAAFPSTSEWEKRRE